MNKLVRSPFMGVVVRKFGKNCSGSDNPQVVNERAMRLFAKLYAAKTTAEELDIINNK